MIIEELRKQYHKDICERIIRIKKSKKGRDYPNFADTASPMSIKIAQGIVNRMGFQIRTMSEEEEETTGQAAGELFEQITKEFLEKAFSLLHHLRPGNWIYTTRTNISQYEQYEHLGAISKALKEYPDLRSVFGTDYIITPDIIVARKPVDDTEINRYQNVVTGSSGIALYTPFRSINSEIPHPFLHASVSCKWTLRTDRAQNARTEALNLVRNRKGQLPHIVAVTGEPMLNRLSSLALGTGDLDCVYHFALKELKETLEDLRNKDSIDFLNMMIQGKRLRDISDLPFDLAV